MEINLEQKFVIENNFWFLLRELQNEINFCGSVLKYLKTF